MGDVIHALPAAASLKRSFPKSRIAWVVEPQWAPLLKQNPSLDTVIAFDRQHLRTWLKTRREMRRHRPAIAIDFQGLVKSALVARAANPRRLFGFGRGEVRERLAPLFYSETIEPGMVHAVDRNLALVQSAGATTTIPVFHLPPGEPEGDLPTSGFILASPLAGWTSKQWPLAYYGELARRLQLPLVLNGAPQSRALLESVPGVTVHISGLSGLIDATRRATAVIGVDSGPMHLAAALGKSGVALFGPTDPIRNGPYGGTLTVLRHTSATPRLRDGGGASGAYIRGTEIDSAMRALTPDVVAASILV